MNEIIFKEVMYCISCESKDVVIGDNHLRFYDFDHDYPYWSVCYGPFTFSPPPVEQEDWELFVDAPSPDELEAINEAAEELRLDFAVA